MKCPNCGFENPEGSMFCKFCGRPMSASNATQAQPYQPRQLLEEGRGRQCVSCGRSISWNANVCQYCGHDYRVPVYAYQPEAISSGMRALFYIVSFLVPLAGIIIGIVYYTRPDGESKRVGKNCIIIAIAVWVAVFAIAIAVYALLLSTFGPAFLPATFVSTLA